MQLSLHPDFYRQKALSMRRLPPRTRYRESHRGAIDSAAMSMLRYVSSISLVAERELLRQTRRSLT